LASGGARGVHVYEILPATDDLDVAARHSLYRSVAPHPSSELETSAEKASDLEVLRSFLLKRQGIETGAELQKVLTEHVDRLDKILKELAEDS
jgi:hypothetical protein